MARQKSPKPAKSVMFHATAADQEMIVQAMAISGAPDQAKAIRAALHAYTRGEPSDALARALKAVVKEALREHDAARGRRRRSVVNDDGVGFVDPTPAPAPSKVSPEVAARIAARRASAIKELADIKETIAAWPRGERQQELNELAIRKQDLQWQIKTGKIPLE